MRILTSTIGHNDNDASVAAEASTRPELSYVARRFDKSLADSLSLLLLIFTRECRNRRRRDRVSQLRQSIRGGLSIAMGTAAKGGAAEAAERAALRAICNIGSNLHDRGGIPALTWAYHRVRDDNPVRAMELQSLWEGIGSWKADVSSSTAWRSKRAVVDPDSPEWAIPSDVLHKAKAVVRAWL